MQVPILSGIYADTSPELRTSYPVNYIPVPKDSGISAGYLRPTEGLETFGTGPGEGRGGIDWNGICYRVMGNQLCRVAANGVITPLGNVGNDNRPASFAYSFDRLAIASAGNLFYWDGTLTQVTDPDLGTVNDVVWVDGYFMTTDGEFLVVTELNDPFAVNPTKYGSSEADPDPVLALRKIRNEVIAINRYTCEYFDNVGSSNFPFARIEGAQIEKGAISREAVCVFNEVLAFLGGGFNEPVAIYLAENAQAVKISTHEIDTLLQEYSQAELAGAYVEYQKDRGHDFLFIHLPDKTLVYDAAASAVIGQPAWHIRTSAITGWARYKARHFTYCYGQWLFDAPGSFDVGQFRQDISSHYGDMVRWEFETQLLYNEGRGAIFNEMELVALTGSAAFGDEPLISTSYSVDGVQWSQDKVINVGNQRGKRLTWYRQGILKNYRTQRFRGTSDAQLSVLRLEGRLEPLAW